MIKGFQINHFRGLQNLAVDNLSNINLFVGANNSGKTSVLEALRLLAFSGEPGQLPLVARQRADRTSKAAIRKSMVNHTLSMFQKIAGGDGGPVYRISLGVDMWDRHCAYTVDGELFETADPEGQPSSALRLDLESVLDGEKPEVHTVTITEESTFVYDRRPIFNSCFLGSTTNYYVTCAALLSSYIIREGKQDLLHILRTFDPAIDDISIVGEDIYLHNTRSGNLPLFAYGSGMQKAVCLTAAIAYCKNGAILADEIDNAIHVSAFEDVFRWFLNACLRWNVQAFITTHSAEAIDAILEIAHEEHSQEDLLRVITLRKDPKTNETRKKVRSGEEAYADRASFQMELRV
ncbi:MAG: AAA family ATPase [Oscillospiraceae bacterium]|nr:AAA family ATPase [Oscillospiraceae bacterium]